MELSVEYSVSGDIDSLVRLVRRGFDAPTVSRTIYSCAGIGEFIEAQLSEPVSDSRYVTVRAGDGIIAFVEYRYLPESLNLNYIVVDRDYRGRGLGGEILRRSLRLLAPSRSKLELDVFSANLPALRWYGKLGFRPCGASYWYDLAVEPVEAVCRDIHLLGYPQFLTTYGRFGFGVLNLLCGRNSYGAGILGDRWIRLTSKDILSDRAALGFLADRYPDRNFFAVLSEPVSDGDYPGVRCSETAKSYRMEIELEKLL